MQLNIDNVLKKGALLSIYPKKYPKLIYEMVIMHGGSPCEGRPLVALQQYTSHTDKLGWQSQALHCWKSLKLEAFFLFT